MAKYDHGGGCACGLYKECCCERAPRDETPKLWRDMTAEEKGALLLAAHEGKVIEYWHNDQWTRCSKVFSHFYVYRVKPDDVRETVTLYGPTQNWSFTGSGRNKGDTHRITFDTINGEPDPASIKMERI